MSAKLHERIKNLGKKHRFSKLMNSKTKVWGLINGQLVRFGRFYGDLAADGSKILDYTKIAKFERMGK